MKYRFFINQETDEQGRLVGFFGYQPGHKLELVYAGEVEAGGSTLHVCEELFYMFNVNRPKDYRNRSMSVGDVLLLTEEDGYVRAFSAESVGFREIDSLDTVLSILYETQTEREKEPAHVDTQTV
jgi:YodL-like